MTNKLQQLIDEIEDHFGFSIAYPDMNQEVALLHQSHVQLMALQSVIMAGHKLTISCVGKSEEMAKWNELSIFADTMTTYLNSQDENEK